MDKQNVVIVGAGQAGAMCARALRRHGFAGSVMLIGDETALPYERPPLSKDVLQGGHLGTPVLTQEMAAEQQIALRLGVSVTRLDRAARSLVLSDGTKVSYDVLVLATGGRPRELPGLPSDGSRVHVLRTFGHAEALKQSIGLASHLIVIGGGWLGLEVAASARARGIAVTVIEREARLCARVLPAGPAAFLAGLHRANGVDLHLGATATISRTDAGVAARLADGTTIEADLACIAIGIAAEDKLAREAGLACDDGVLTDGCGRTSDPAVFAIGDVARLTHDGLRRSLRLESWHNANAQAELAARAILGQAASYDEVPWFWSDQFGRRIQIVGVPEATDEVIAEEPGEKPLWRLGARGVVTSVVAVDRPRDIGMARRNLLKTA